MWRWVLEQINLLGACPYIFRHADTPHAPGKEGLLDGSGPRATGRLNQDWHIHENQGSHNCNHFLLITILVDVIVGSRSQVLFIRGALFQGSTLGGRDKVWQTIDHQRRKWIKTILMMPPEVANIPKKKCHSPVVTDFKLGFDPSPKMLA